MSVDDNIIGEEEVYRIKEVLASLENSGFDYLQIELGEMKLVVGKGQPPAQSVSAPVPTAPAVVAVPSVTAPAQAPASVSTSAQAAATAAPASAETGSAPRSHPGLGPDVELITAPIVGIFYAQPEPGALAFVSVGTRVEPDTTVALIEVMKLFNAVASGVSGEVIEVLVENGDFVEHGQPLFAIRKG